MMTYFLTTGFPEGMPLAQPVATDQKQKKRAAGSVHLKMMGRTDGTHLISQFFAPD